MSSTCASSASASMYMCMWILAIILTSVCDYANYEAYLHHPMTDIFGRPFYHPSYVSELSICVSVGCVYYTVWLLHLSCHWACDFLPCTAAFLSLVKIIVAIFLHAFLGLYCGVSFG